MSARTALMLGFPSSRERSRDFSARRFYWGFCVLCGALGLALLLDASGLAAKQKAPATKTVSGMVADKTENGIGGAEVTLKDLQTGKTMAIYADAKGQYHFSDLDPHHDYAIQARFKGVASETRQVSSFDTRSKVVINLSIPPPSS